MKLAIAGAGGRMGKHLIESTLALADASLGAAFEIPGSPLIGRDAGESLGRQTGVLITAYRPELLQGVDCLIDFTRPAGTLEHLAGCVAAGSRMVIGTTGFDDAGKATISAAAQRIPLLFAPNMSVGVNVLFRLLDVAARTLGEGYDIEVIEAHHRHKVDAPSGTALRMGEVLANALGRDLKSCAVYGREGVTGERDSQTIGFATIRGGDIIGDHTGLFAGTGERIEITHRSQSRATYAVGALRAARYLMVRAPGLYDMQDVLGLR